MAEAFKTDGMYDVLLQTDELFKKFDSSRIIPHSSAKLESMWKEIKGKYKIAKSNFTKSGTHESDFRMFCDGNGGVLYLHLCLQSKPELTNYVCEGFLNGDKFDSLDFTPSSIASSSVNSRNVVTAASNTDFDTLAVEKSLHIIADKAKDSELLELEKANLRHKLWMDKVSSLDTLTNMINKTEKESNSEKRDEETNVTTKC